MYLVLKNWQNVSVSHITPRGSVGPQTDTDDHRCIKNVTLRDVIIHNGQEFWILYIIQWGISVNTLFW